MHEFPRPFPLPRSSPRLPARRAALAAVLMMAGPSMAVAQDGTVQPGTAAPPAAANAPGAAEAAKPATLANELRPTFVRQGPADRVTSRLVGLTIQNGANETIGEIADLVLDETFRVKAWVVGVGGFLGIGTKYVAIDPSALTVARVDDKTLKATIDTTRDQLRAAPEYVYLGKEKTADKASEKGSEKAGTAPAGDADKPKP